MSNSDELVAFWDHPETSLALEAWIAAGLEEDRVAEDVTTRMLFPDELEEQVVATITAGESGTVCGGPAAVSVFRHLDDAAVVRECVPEGAVVSPDAVVLRVEASLRAVLGGERVALNIFGHLSGIATRTRTWVGLAGSTPILDTRKTIPGLRRFQRYAVRAGGGVNHRMDLSELPLVKENHRDLLRRRLRFQNPHEEIAAILDRAEKYTGSQQIEIEVEDRESFLACADLGVEAVLLDNQTPAEIASWIEDARTRGDRLPRILEASGGITDKRLAEYARSGVTRVSLGALTHSVRVLDLSLHVTWGSTEVQS